MFSNPLTKLFYYLLSLSLSEENVDIWKKKRERICHRKAFSTATSVDWQFDRILFVEPLKMNRRKSILATRMILWLSMRRNRNKGVWCEQLDWTDSLSNIRINTSKWNDHFLRSLRYSRSIHVWYDNQSKEKNL